ncbi:MAG: hypothetical protein GF308_20305 [Candidatus Heimdallarchaeota archaeon]|nr:hypothetical protein [Candidatus Heimdallarchaeota archaeon]
MDVVSNNDEDGDQSLQNEQKAVVNRSKNEDVEDIEKVEANSSGNAEEAVVEDEVVSPKEGNKEAASPKENQAASPEQSPAPPCSEILEEKKETEAKEELIDISEKSLSQEQKNTSEAATPRADANVFSQQDQTQEEDLTDDFEEASTEEEEAEEEFDKHEFIYQKLVKKRNHVYSCIANVLRNYRQKEVLDSFIPEREKLATNLSAILMTKEGLTPRDFGTISQSISDNDQDSENINEIIALSAINFLINQVQELAVEEEGELEFSKEAKEHLTTLAFEWAKLRDQAFMFSNGMIKLEYELHGELHFVKTELYHETEKKLKSIGISRESSASSKLRELRDQRRKISYRAISDLNEFVRSWHSEIAYLRRIPEFYASMRQLSEEELETLSMLFENFGALMTLTDLKKPFKTIPLEEIRSMRKNAEKDHSALDQIRLHIFETLMKFEYGKEDVPYFLCRRIQKKGKEYLEIPVISLLLFSRFCNSYSETTRSKKAHDLEYIVSDIAELSGWEIVDQNVEIVSEGDTVTEIDLIIKRKKTHVIIEVKDLALWRGWYYDRESLIKRYEIFTTAAKKLRERRLLLKLPSARLLIVTALTERWKKAADDVPIVPLKSLHSYLKKLKRLEKKKRFSKRKRRR